ncbi:MAG: MBL fold metallo-hydrolase [Deltaproteobacteria bacterium]|nr:MBL fold metallo-hydrolase [Deltaproteobacteria bacterium]MBW2140489.1 MBL fold metallo-hydrolase [Deltaproteobacteria bacterium]
MDITFYGAVREVTGSMHLISTENDRVLLDCGMFQGRRKESEQKNRVLPIDPRIITNIVLSHAHIDHSGRIPLVTNGDFHGNIFTTRATMDASEYLLLDSAHIQESDAGYLNYKTARAFMYQQKASPRTQKVTKRELNNVKSLLKKNRNKLNVKAINDLIDKYHLEGVRSLYTTKEAQQALKFFDGYPYCHPITIGRDMVCTFYDAGHILGSAISVIRVNENGRSCAIGYTGDLGRFESPIIKDPTLVFSEEDRNLDLLIMESTYGDRFHDPVRDLRDQLKQVINDTIERGGSVVIPSFAFGRTQELVYVLHELYNAGEVPRLPVYVDSPLASNLTRVFGEHMEVYDRETHETFLDRGENPFSFEQIRFVESVEESMVVMRERKQHIIIAASGMCEAGRILHHLRYKIHNPRNTILIVGYMAAHTLGRRLLEQGEKYEESGRSGPPPMLKFLNKEYPLQARVVKLGGFSAHADKNELLHFLKESNLNIKKIALVHGEEEQSLSLAQHLKDEGLTVMVPHSGETVHIK